MKRVTFGHKLLNFANTADILEKESFSKIQKSIETYLYKVLKIRFVRLMLMKETVNGQLMLVKYVLNREESDILPVKEGDEYNGQMAYAFDKNKRLWITAEKETENLNETENYIDQWSNIEQEKLPKYREINSEVDIKTSIIVPIRRDKNDGKTILGVVNFESEEYLSFNKYAEKELKDISYTLGKLFQLYELRGFQKSNTISVINELENELDDFTLEFKDFFFNRKPNIFFAFPDRGDREVIGSVRELFSNKLSKELKLISWDDETNLGSITPQMLDNIKKSDYFVCYLSEKIENSEHYTDNANVLIEIGLFLGNQIREKHFKNIIILRESNSKIAIPFDIQDIFILEIPRIGEENHVNRDTFILNLEKKVSTFLRDAE